MKKAIKKMLLLNIISIICLTKTIYASSNLIKSFDLPTKTIEHLLLNEVNHDEILVIFDFDHVFYDPTSFDMSVNLDAKDFLNYINEEKIQSIVWTAREPELLNVTVRTIELDDLNFNILEHIPNDKTHFKHNIFENITESYLERINESVFYNLIGNSENLLLGCHRGICTIGHSISKGHALTTFLKHHQLNYKYILFIDDKTINLESVQNVLKKTHQSTTVLTYEYRALR